MTSLEKWSFTSKY